MNNEWNMNCCKVTSNDVLGRHVIATKNIKPGDVILNETPLLIMPKWEADVCCPNCFRESISICGECKKFPLCLNCTSHNKFDCEFAQNAVNLPENFLIENFKIIGIFKCFLLKENPETSHLFQSFLNMESHLEDRRDTEIWKMHEENIVKPFMNLQANGFGIFKKTKDLDSDLIQTICGSWDVNAFDVRGPEQKPLSGIYPTALLLSHDCVANTIVSVDETFAMKIYASQNIREGELVTYNYTSPLLGTLERKSRLKISKYFDCYCKRCEDPKEFGTHLSSIACTNCRNGLCTFTEKDGWKCSSCSISSSCSVLNLLQTAQQDIINANGDLRQLEMLIIKYTRQLNPQHYLVLDMKQNVASILREICENEILRPGQKVFERKIQLCREILTILRKIQPGLSRLTGIALYEYYDPLVQLAHQQFNDADLSMGEYYMKLQTAENLLKEAIKMLIYEPLRTPEGQLVKRAFSELKELRDHMQNIEVKENLLKN